MIKHYFKVAFRNLWKYKVQNIISVIGLAVGLLCFSVCMYCSRFVESTNHCFDNYSRIAELNFYVNISNDELNYIVTSLYSSLSSVIRRTSYLGYGRSGSDFLYGIFP